MVSYLVIEMYFYENEVISWNLQHFEELEQEGEGGDRCSEQFSTIYLSKYNTNLPYNTEYIR